MKKQYEIVKDEITKSHLILATFEDGSGTWIPLDPANSDYAEYLCYTAWVEAGNNPEDFWSQSEDFLDTSVSEVSEPKEEEEGES